MRTTDLYAPLSLGRLLLWLLLLPLWILLWIGVRVKPKFYAWGLFSSFRASKPVIGIGNLTLGGTGKSPLASLLLEHFLNRGMRPALLSRGYGASLEPKANKRLDQENQEGGPERFGDEPWMLFSQRPEALFMVGPDRVASAKLAQEEAEVLLLDDGFQHLKLQRDLDLLLVDSTRGWGNGKLVPLGPMREPVEALKRAHAVILTRSDQGEPELWEERIRAIAPELPLFRSHLEPSDPFSSKGGSLPLRALEGAKVALFSGIANPASFAGSLEGLGAKVIEHLVLPDHQEYSTLRIEELEGWMRRYPEARVMTTQKDFVKLKAFADEIPEFWWLPVRMNLPEEFFLWLDESFECARKMRGK